MTENPHIEGGELDGAKDVIDKQVDLTIDPSTQVYAGDPAPVIAAIAQGGGLTLQQAKDAVSQFLPVVSAIGVAFPAAAPIINGLATVLKAVPK